MKAKIFYIARDKCETQKPENSEYFWFKRKKDIKFDPEGGLPYDSGELNVMNPEDFERDYGIKMKPGEIKKFRLEEVE